MFSFNSIKDELLKHQMQIGVKIYNKKNLNLIQLSFTVWQSGLLMDSSLQTAQKKKQKLNIIVNTMRLRAEKVGNSLLLLFHHRSIDDDSSRPN